MSIPQILCINLDHRADRLAEFSANINKLALNFERVAAVQNKSEPQKGCKESHIKCLELAISNGWEWVMICEDDFDFLVNRETLQKYLESFKNNNDAVLLSFCPNMPKIREVVNPCFYRVNFMYSTGCYIIKRIHYETLMNFWKSTDKPVDCWHFLMDQYVYLITDKKVGTQRPSFSDIVGKFRDPDHQIFKFKFKPPVLTLPIPKPVPKPALKIKPKPVPRPVLKTKPKSVPKPALKTKPKPVLKPVLKTKPKPKPKPIPKPTFKTKPKPMPKPTFKTTPKSVPKPERSPKAVAPRRMPRARALKRRINALQSSQAR